MNLFDIIGPVMVGPSSSHTAGAVRIGYIAGKLLAEPVASAEILLYGSFLATGSGHGTKEALVAGLLGMQPDDERIPNSFRVARESGVQISFGEAVLKNAHPNSVKLILTGQSGIKTEIVGASIGGSRIRITEIDGLTVNITGDYPTLVVRNHDEPGLVAEVTGVLERRMVNIAAMQLHRSRRGEDAVMVIECDQEVWDAAICQVRELDGVEKVIYLSLKDE